MTVDDGRLPSETPELGLERFNANVSLGSLTPSSIECSVMSLEVSPGANVSVPYAAV